MSGETLRQALERHRQGDLDAAERLYRAVLATEPNQPDACHNLGVITLRRQGPLASLPHFEGAVRANPEQGQYWLSYAEVLLAAERLPDAWNALLEGIKHGLSGPATAALLQKMQPILGPAEGTLSLRDMCFRFRTALLAASQTKSLRQRIAGAIEDFRAGGTSEQARELIDSAQILQDLQDEDLAWQAMQAAALLDSAAWEPRWIGARMTPRVCGSVAESELWYARLTAGIDALAALPPPQTRSEAERALQGLLRQTNFDLAYYGRDERRRQEAFGALACRVMETLFPDCKSLPVRPPRSARAGDRRIRIGYASSYFSSHTITLLFNGWIWPLDRERFKVHAYLVGGPSDASTAELRRAVEIFRDVRDERGNLRPAIDQIRADELDILVYPEIGMDSRAFCLAALRLAPTQCVGWGHPITTGLSTVDFFLSSDLMEPENAASHYSERLIRLPGTSLFYSRPNPGASRSRKDLGLPQDGVLYLCCQAVQKYRPQFDYVFPAIARSVPTARFVFVLQPKHLFANRVFRHRLKDAFRTAGLDPAEHLVFLNWLPWTDFLALNAACDVFLDSIGWSGGNTTLEALAHGIPVVTLPGSLMRSRHSYAFLKALGVEDGIARDAADFIEKAKAFGLDAELRRSVSARVRAAHDRLYGDTSAIAALQEFYAQNVP